MRLAQDHAASDSTLGQSQPGRGAGGRKLRLTLPASCSGRILLSEPGQIYWNSQQQLSVDTFKKKWLQRHNGFLDQVKHHAPIHNANCLVKDKELNFTKNGSSGNSAILRGRDSQLYWVEFIVGFNWNVSFQFRKRVEESKWVFKQRRPGLRGTWSHLYAPTSLKKNVVHSGLYFLAGLIFQERKHIILPFCRKGICSLWSLPDKMFVSYSIFLFFLQDDSLLNPSRRQLNWQLELSVIWDFNK